MTFAQAMQGAGGVVTLNRFGYFVQRLTLAACLLATAGCSSPSSDDVPRSSGPVRIPVDYPTIQAGIDAARTGDTVLVARGIYTGPGNRDLQLSGKSIVLKSEAGPRVTSIDCRGSALEPHFGIDVRSGASSSIIDGFTIKAGYSNHGAGICCYSASPTVKNCILVDNHATVSGGAVRCKGASPHFINCTIVQNIAPSGGGMFLIANSSPSLRNCIIAYSRDGGAVYSSESTSLPMFECCDLFGNIGGDWEGRISEQAAINGNLCSDPMFCGMDDGDFRVRPESPCAVTDNNCTKPIGISEIGCSE